MSLCTGPCMPPVQPGAVLCGLQHACTVSAQAPPATQDWIHSHVQIPPCSIMRMHALAPYQRDRPTYRHNFDALLFHRSSRRQAVWCRHRCLPTSSLICVRTVRPGPWVTEPLCEFAGVRPQPRQLTVAPISDSSNRLPRSSDDKYRL